MNRGTDHSAARLGKAQDPCDSYDLGEARVSHPGRAQASADSHALGQKQGWLVPPGRKIPEIPKIRARIRGRLSRQGPRFLRFLRFGQGSGVVCLGRAQDS